MNKSALGTQVCNLRIEGEAKYNPFPVPKTEFPTYIVALPVHLTYILLFWLVLFFPFLRNILHRLTSQWAPREASTDFCVTDTGNVNNRQTGWQGAEYKMFCIYITECILVQNAKWIHDTHTQKTWNGMWNHSKSISWNNVGLLDNISINYWYSESLSNVRQYGKLS